VGWTAAHASRRNALLTGLVEASNNASDPRLADTVKLSCGFGPDFFTSSMMGPVAAQGALVAAGHAAVVDQELIALYDYMQSADVQAALALCSCLTEELAKFFPTGDPRLYRAQVYCAVQLVAAGYYLEAVRFLHRRPPQCAEQFADHAPELARQVMVFCQQNPDIGEAVGLLEAMQGDGAADSAHIEADGVSDAGGHNIHHRDGGPHARGTTSTFEASPPSLWHARLQEKQALPEPLHAEALRLADLLLSPQAGERDRHEEWLLKVLSLPFGVYAGRGQLSDAQRREVLEAERKKLDAQHVGDEQMKQAMLAQLDFYMRSDTAGHVLALTGAPGTGKTTLMQKWFAEATGRPVVVISMSGASHASALQGASVEYRGSFFGQIVEGLVTSKCMNPIFFFDEIDKIGEDDKGDALMRIFVSLLDPATQGHFVDIKLGRGMELDLSRCSFAVSYNDDRRLQKEPAVVSRLVRPIAFSPPTSNQLEAVIRERFAPQFLEQAGRKKHDVYLSPNLMARLLHGHTGTRDLQGRVEDMLAKVLHSQTLKGFAFPISVDADPNNPVGLKVDYANNKVRQAQYKRLCAGRATPQQREEHRLFFSDVHAAEVLRGRMADDASTEKFGD
jgi:hypothetical protein